jgi:uncharacterized membrane-anchored protein
MPPIEDHPLRYPLTNELHARPFPSLEAPCTAVFLAIKEPLDAANRDRSRDRAHLIDLLDRNGSPHPQPEATHFSGLIGRHELKWESHTEFVTFSAFSPGVSARPFDPEEMRVFPDNWLATAPGKRLVSLLIRVEVMPEDEDEVTSHLEDWFVPESLACSRVVDGAAIVAGDFRIDPAGQMRFAVFVRPGTGARRVGRIVQRLCEIETYRAMSMLGLIRARRMSARLNEIDPKLSALVRVWTAPAKAPRRRCTSCWRFRQNWKARPCRCRSALARPPPMRRSSISASKCCGKSASRAARPSANS